MNTNTTTTTTQKQREEQFELILTQLKNATHIAVMASTSQDPHYRAACHLVGVASYISELAHSIKASMELSK